MSRLLLLVALSLAVALPSFARAENWPNWRGPNLNGVAEGKEYPTKWSNTENVAWKVKCVTSYSIIRQSKRTSQEPPLQSSNRLPTPDDEFVQLSGIMS